MDSCKDFFEQSSLKLIAQQAFLKAQERGVVDFATKFNVFDLEEITLDKKLIIDLIEKIQIYGIEEVINNIDLILVYYQSVYNIENFVNTEE